MNIIKRVSVTILCILALLPALSSAQETILSEPFVITALKFRSSYSVGRYPDCLNCVLIEGAVSESCGNGFVIYSAGITNEEFNMLKSLALLAYSTKKKVQIGRAHCVQWNGEWRGEVNRIYIVE